jgi:malonyl-CoA decarboxylase
MAGAMSPGERLLAVMDERAALLATGRADVRARAPADGLAGQLSEWLDPARLTLTRVTRDSPETLLERIIEYEAVHPVRGPHDLQRRLDQDRRCYAFTHPALPDEPLIFTEVALTFYLAAGVRYLLDPDVPARDPFDARCAQLYSISSGHAGLRGVRLGGALVARVAAELRRTCPSLDTIATLSPVAGFMTWLDAVRATDEGDDDLGRQAESAREALDCPGWPYDPRRAAGLRERLVPLCAYYLVDVTRDGEPDDPVARFHLRNGARLERINWLGNPSPSGLRQSAGLMVNYLYWSRRPDAAYDAWSDRSGRHASPLVEQLAASALM